MAVKIRLSRTGKTNRPFYRLIATDSRKKRDGQSLANLGAFDPLNNVVLQFHEDLYQDFIAKGAIVTDSAKKIYKLYKKTGLVSGFVAEKGITPSAQTVEKDETPARSEAA